VTARVRAFVPWLVVAVVLAAGVCALAWPRPTGRVVGGVVGTVALVAGVRMLLEEQREKAAPRSSTCAGCVGCGGPDCVQLADDLPAFQAKLRTTITEIRAAAYRECADLLRDAHFRDGLTVQQIGTALRNTADQMGQQ
jgi:hypothetical protein